MVPDLQCRRKAMDMLGSPQLIDPGVARRAQIALDVLGSEV
jgi:hypothetical protein